MNIETLIIVIIAVVILLLITMKAILHSKLKSIDGFGGKEEIDLNEKKGNVIKL